MTRDETIIKYDYVVKIRAKYFYGLLRGLVDLDDLISVGRIGLIKAVDNFDPNKKVKISHYINHRVNGHIKDYLRKLDTIPKKMRFDIKKIKNANSILSQKLQRIPTSEELAEYLNIPVNQLHRFFYRVTSTSDSVRVAEKVESTILSEIIKNQEYSQLHSALNALSPRDRKVIKYLYEDELTCLQSAKKLKLCESRISQLHKSIIKKLKEILNESHFAIAA